MRAWAGALVRAGRARSRDGRGLRARNALLVVTATLAVPSLASSPLSAQERILDYDIGVDVRPDASLEVTERITVHAEGRQIRRGIYRDFPTRYRDRFGNRVRVDLEVLSVERNGEPEPWFTERLSNGVRINTGDDSFLPVPAEHTLTIRYRTTRQLGFFDEHDELYWNAIGTGWVFPIERGRVVVRLPEPVPTERLDAEAYTGRQGARGQQYEVDLAAPGTARYSLTAPLAPGEGFTIVLGFPKGVVQEPTRTQRLGWLLRDNAGVLVSFAGLLALLVFCVGRWQSLGRDPPKGVVFARYDPPVDLTPAGARYLRRMGYDDRCFVSDVLDLAVAGHLNIDREEGRDSGEWRLEQRGDGDLARQLTGIGRQGGTAPGAAGHAADHDVARHGTAASGDTGQPRRPVASTSGGTAAVATGDAQAALFDRIFPGSTRSLTLHPRNASKVREARSVHRHALDDALHGRYFHRNGSSVAVAVAIMAASTALAVLVSGGNGLPLVIGAALLMGAVTAVFSRLVRAPTREGRGLLDEIEGLRLYLGVAERDELAALRGPEAERAPPPLDGGRYEALLPYAVALDVEDAWTKKFTTAVGAAAAAEAARRMHWYHGHAPVTDLGSFSRALGSGLSTGIASAATPPGSSSGGGGGGFSGGGGGGGGGGGR